MQHLLYPLVGPAMPASRMGRNTYIARRLTPEQLVNAVIVLIERAFTLWPMLGCLSHPGKMRFINHMDTLPFATFVQLSSAFLRIVNLLQCQVTPHASFCIHNALDKSALM